MEYSLEIKSIIDGCKKNDVASQKSLYKRYASKIMGICKRYIKNQEESEEIVMDTFITVFKKINQLENIKTLEAWMYKIAVNNCLMQLRKKVNFTMSIDATYDFTHSTENPVEKLYEKDILLLLNDLPEGSRTVFNLYAIEGYKHKEIAQMLDISEGTSKSQLNFAKNKLKEVLKSRYGVIKSAN